MIHFSDILLFGVLPSNPFPFGLTQLGIQPRNVQPQLWAMQELCFDVPAFPLPSLHFDRNGRKEFLGTCPLCC